MSPDPGTPPDTLGAPIRAVSLDTVDHTAVMRLDDGKANALSHSVIEQINDALDRAEADPDVRTLVIFGRPGRFSGGFDLDTMSAGPESARSLVVAGARMLVRVYGFPRPVIAGCTGHAIAAGALLLLASDLRIGVSGDAKIGLNEVAIGMPLPVFAVELARARLSRRHFTRATALATIYRPDQAVEIGFLDEVVTEAELESRVLETASEIGGRLSLSGFAATRSNDRLSTMERILASLDEDQGDLDPGS
jgi:enoyl-CoA hydratase